MRSKCRNSSGQISYVLGIILIASIIGAGAFAVDITHFVSAQQDLQCAVDAAALAGAAQLSEDSLEKCRAEALTLSARNTVEGVSVSNSSADTTVDVEVKNASPVLSGSVTVIATHKINSIFGPFFGRVKEIVSATATASGMGQITQIPLGFAFPLALSIDARPVLKDGIEMNALSQYKAGEEFEIFLGPGNDKNAAFTSFGEASSNDKFFKDAIDDVLGTGSPEPVVPSLEVGREINLTNGQSAFHYLLNDPRYSAMLSQPAIVFPLIEGSPPFQQSSKVIGFIALKVTGISKERGIPCIQGVILRPAIRGRSGPGYSGSYRQVVNELSPLAIRLVR